MRTAIRKALIALLKYTAEEYSNHGCNEFDLTREADLEESEVAEIQARIASWHGKNAEASSGPVVQDWILMRALAGILDEGTEDDDLGVFGEDDKTSRDHIAEAIGFIGQMFHPGAILAKYAKDVASHDPCTNCGHGRFQHKPKKIQDATIRSADDAMSVTQCRYGHFSALDPKVRDGCKCEVWQGIETPFEQK